jgi:hypothetical protein
LAFSEGCAIFAVFCVASIRASWIAIAACSACAWVRLALVRLLKVIWCLSTASKKASVHFLISVSLRLNLWLLGCAFVGRWPWSIVHVMGKWSDANESLWFTCYSLIIELFEAGALVKVKALFVWKL